MEINIAHKAINSPFRYAGGKFYARRLILEQIPVHKNYIEIFAGGGSIFFAKPKVEFNWLNDIDKDLVNTYKMIQQCPHEMAEVLSNEVATKERHAYYKNDYKPRTSFEKAIRWFYLNRTSYSGIMKKENCYWGYGEAYSMGPKNWGLNILRVSKKLSEINITSRDFEAILDEIQENKNTFLFIDPPYYKADQSKFYTHAFTLEDHQRLHNALKRNHHKFKFMLTYDNCEEVRELYNWAYEIDEKEWNYMINRTDDQTKKTDKKGERYKGKELFIRNYELEPLISEFKFANNF